MSLGRVLEPEVMDTPEEARDYDAMDFAEVNARFVDDFLAAHGPCRGGTILDLGTGTARIPIRLCQVDPGARVTAIDLSRNMIELARQNIAGAGLAGRITAELADAKGLGRWPDGMFEGVISNSIVHHIPDPLPVLAKAVRLTAPGGTIFVRDLARPESEDELERLVMTYAGGESEHGRAMFAASLRAALRLEEVRALVARLGLDPAGVSMSSDRHWTWAAKRA